MVVGGPVANFVFAIVVLALLFMTYGQPFTPAEVGQVQPSSGAEAGGIHPGDLIVSIDGSNIHRFEDVQQVVRLNPGVPMTLIVRRDGQPVTLHVTPTRTEITDRFGDRHEIGLLGIGRSGVEYVRRNPIRAAGSAVQETWNLSVGTLEAMWQIIIGTRGSDELGGPLRIAQMSGEVARGGVVQLLWFMAVLSIQLRLVHLFPVAGVYGGQLVFFAAEAIRGGPPGETGHGYGI